MPTVVKIARQAQAKSRFSITLSTDCRALYSAATLLQPQYRPMVAKIRHIEVNTHWEITLRPAIDSAAATMDAG